MRRNEILQVEIDDEHIVLQLAGGRALRTPLKRYIRLEKATPAQRRSWVLTDANHGVSWPELVAPHPHGMISVWELEQDALYEAALARLKEAGWNVAALSPDDHDLVALWRLEADINNGGFLQFLCNWGEENCQRAIAALEKIGAPAAHKIVTEMYGVVAPYGETDEVVSLGDLPALLSDAERDRLYTLDQAFWGYPDRLNKLVVERYGV